MAAPITCENCGTTIGQLEDAHIWMDRPVCAACKKRIDAKNRPAQNGTMIVAIAGALVAVMLAGALIWVSLVNKPATAFGASADRGSTTAPVGSPRYEFKHYAWTEKQPPVKMLHKDEGFCYLTSVRGAFNGGGEGAHVTLNDDGYWYLGGATATGYLHVEAMSVKILPPE